MSLAALPLRAREHGRVTSIPALVSKDARRSLIVSTTPLYPPSDSDDSHSLHKTTDDMMNQTSPIVVEQRAPALPARSALRASRMLDLNMHKLALAAQEQPPPFAQPAPHDVYLSSEEDASSSADDFSDFDFDSGSEDSPDSTKRRGSHEDTARVVSVIFSGKPSLVDLPRRSMSPSSQGSLSRPPSRLRRTSTDPVLSVRRLSICSSSTSSTSTTSSSSILHPPRTSSMGTRKLEKQRPQFLSIDPFASKTEVDEDHERPRTPKTPTGVFKRTLSLVRKKSKPSLHQHFLQSRDNLTLSIPHHMEQVQEEIQEESPIPEPMSAPMSAPISRQPVTYQDIMRSAKRRTQTQPLTPMSPMSEPPPTPMTPNSTRSRLRNGFNAARRRSMKA